MSEKRDTVHAVLVAGGSGTRMGTKTKKQFLTLGGKPLICHALGALQESEIVDDIILVTAPEDIPYCEENIVRYYDFSKVRAITAGGSDRTRSVFAGLLAISPEKEKNFSGTVTSGASEFVIIHDGARPFLTDALIRRSVDGARGTGAAVAAIPVSDTIKVADANDCIHTTLERRTLRAMQTPQTFSYPLIRYAYDRLMEEEAANDAVTDDAMVVERYCPEVRILLVEGDDTNRKITTQTDLILAEAILQSICTDASE